MRKCACLCEFVVRAVYVLWWVSSGECTWAAGSREQQQGWYSKPSGIFWRYPSCFQAPVFQNSTWHVCMLLCFCGFETGMVVYRVCVLPVWHVLSWGTLSQVFCPYRHTLDLLRGQTFSLQRRPRHDGARKKLKKSFGLSMPFSSSLERTSLSSGLQEGMPFPSAHGVVMAPENPASGMTDISEMLLLAELFGISPLFYIPSLSRGS